MATLSIGADLWSGRHSLLHTVHTVHVHSVHTEQCIQPWMKEIRDNTWGRGGLPTLPSLMLSTIQPSQRGFFRVHMSVRRERDPEPEFTNFSGLQASVPKNEQIGFGNPLSSCYTRTTVLHMQAELIPWNFFHLLKV
jgi:hypothetical protein